MKTRSSSASLSQSTNNEIDGVNVESTFYRVSMQTKSCPASVNVAILTVLSRSQLARSVARSTCLISEVVKNS